MSGWLVFFTAPLLPPALLAVTALLTDEGLPLLGANGSCGGGMLCRDSVGVCERAARDVRFVTVVRESDLLARVLRGIGISESEDARKTVSSS